MKADTALARRRPRRARTKPPGSGSLRNMRAIVATVCKYVFIVGLSATTVLPFLWMVSSSLKLDRDVFAIPMRWIPSPVHWENYVQVFQKVSFATYYLNTLKIAGAVLILQLLTCTMAAFSFTKLRYPGRSALLIVYIATLMVPSQVTMIPQFIIVRNLGLFNTHGALILLAGFSAFGTFLLVQFFRGIPGELMDACKIDGAGYMVAYWRIILPLSLPALSALGIMSVIGEFNAFMQPMIYLNDEKLRTITLGLRSLVTEYVSAINLQMAGTVMALVPIVAVYVIAQEQIIKGISFNGGAGVKG
ncbi:MAG: carbohydrate ABC transporter permease [Oscillospiraceae bacterium]|nr:carbohydrate ABC transporter permease [Oscillospiraceae bacterium]